MPAKSDADAVYVGGVKLDEYGEFIHDEDQRRASSGFGDDYGYGDSDW